MRGQLWEHLKCKTKSPVAWVRIKMFDSKNILHNMADFVNKYKVIIISMLFSAVIIIGGVKFFADKEEVKIYKNAASQIIDLSQKIMDYYRTSPSYWGLSTEVVINKKLYVHDMKVSEGILLNILGKPTEVGSDEHGNAVMPTAKNFVIAFTKLNKKQCIGIGSQKFNKRFWLMVNKIIVKGYRNSQEFKWGDKDYGLPANKRKLRNLCTDDNNSVIIHF